jgi:hypothetical protein
MDNKVITYHYCYRRVPKGIVITGEFVVPYHTEQGFFRVLEAIKDCCPLKGFEILYIMKVDV